jgi:hypothetical protein
LTTNVVVWTCHDWYPHTPEGLFACYVQAIPFFRSMLAGDVFYAAVLFGAHALASAHAAVVAPGAAGERRRSASNSLL